MVEIFDVKHHKLAVLDDDLKVKSPKGVALGKVLINGDVYDSTADKIGYFTEDGYIYMGAKKVGRVTNEGKVFDYENRQVGSVTGEHIKLAGAALLLLVR